MIREPIRYVVYLRASIGRQGKGGLGMDAQYAAVVEFVRQHGGTIVAQYVEVESGNRSDRPEFAKALESARKGNATLLIAKLDRLVRNVAFIASLMEAGIEFRACDQPFASRLTLHILAAEAENERRRISERTKAALQAAKARGVKLGRGRINYLPAVLASPKLTPDFCRAEALQGRFGPPTRVRSLRVSPLKRPSGGHCRGQRSDGSGEVEARDPPV